MKFLFSSKGLKKAMKCIVACGISGILGFSGVKCFAFRSRPKINSSYKRLGIRNLNANAIRVGYEDADIICDLNNPSAGIEDLRKSFATMSEGNIYDALNNLQDLATLELLISRETGLECSLMNWAGQIDEFITDDEIIEKAFELLGLYDDIINSYTVPGSMGSI